MIFIIYLAFWKHTCFFGYLLIMDVIWNVNVFSADIRLVSVPGSDVSG